MDLSSETEVKLILPTWVLDIRGNTTTDIPLDDTVTTNWRHELTLSASRDLTHAFNLNVDYKYTYAQDGSNSDTLSGFLGWKFRDTSLALAYDRSRVFEDEEEITYVYTLEFSTGF